MRLRVLLLLLLFVPAPLQAEPIVLTGHVEAHARTVGSIELMGEEFSIIGNVRSMTLPGCCMFPDEAYDPGWGFYGGHLLGAAITMAGETFLLGPPANPAAAVLLDLITSPFLLPALVADNVTLHSPFSMTGTVGKLDGPTVNVMGSGIVSLDLFNAGPAWDVRTLRFEFDSTPAPEPATLALVGTGLVLALRRRMRRK